MVSAAWRTDVWVVVNPLYTADQQEQERLRELISLDVLDTEPESRFDEIVALAASIWQAPIAMISLVDHDRQWFKSKIGVEGSETPRSIAFCHHAIQGSGVFIVPDATQDERFRDNPLVTGELGAQFYAGAVMTTSNGQNIGALCVLDQTPRESTPEQIQALQILARQVVAQLELTRSLRISERRFTELKLSEHVRLETHQILLDSMAAMNEGLIVQDGAANVILCNKRAGEILGVPAAELRGSNLLDPRWRFVDAEGIPLSKENLPGWMAFRLACAQEAIVGVYRYPGAVIWLCMQSCPLMNADESHPHAVVTTLTDITAKRLSESTLDRYVSALSENTIELEVMRQETAHLNQQLRELAERDGLTGLSNHSKFQHTVSEIVARETASSLLLIGIDEFRKYNRRYGHARGDHLLQLLTYIILQVIPDRDHACRYAGDQIALILPGATVTAAEEVAEGLAEAFRVQDWPIEPVSVSIGTATVHEGGDVELLLEAAEEAIQRAKAAGKIGYALGKPTDSFRKAG